MRKRINLLVFVFLALSLVTGPVLAQQGSGNSNQGQDEDVYTGTISSDGGQSAFVVTLEEGTTVVITAIATSGDLDTILRLIGPEGSTVAENDDYEFPTTFNSQIVYDVPESGIYTVIVTNFSGTGDFEMTVQYDADVNTSGGGSVADGDEMFFTGYMGDDVSDDTYTVFLEEGQGVIITAEAAPGSDLDTYLFLDDPDGRQVAENDDDERGGTFNSQIIYVAEQTGEYTVVMSNYPGSRGDYELTIVITDGDGLDTTGGGTSGIGDVTSILDAEYEGFMSDDVSDDTYTVFLEEGQGVIITAEAAPGSDLDTYIFLDSPSGLEVAENDDDPRGGTLNSQIVYIAEETGDYTVVMSNYPGSEGDYILTISVISADETDDLTTTASAPEINTTPEREPDEVFTGTIRTDEDEEEYPLQLQAGDNIIAALYETDNRMDTLLYVLDPNGMEILRNDDRGDYDTLDSQIAFTAQVDGEYTLVVTNYPGAPGDYRLEVYFATSEEVALAEQALRVVLSGPVLTLDTENFRIHYTLEGADATTLDFVQQVAQALEEVYDIQINQLGWAAPPSDITQGGDGRIDVYIVNLSGALGYQSTSSAPGDNPNTEVIEEQATAGYFVLDNDYSESEDPIQIMRATAAHEFHHVIQSGYDDSEYGDFSWFYESTSSWMETVTFPSEEDATGYVQDVFLYPEVCFGGQGEADVSGLGIYGTWLFFEFMQTNLGPDAPFELWNNMIPFDGWDVLEATLSNYGENITSFIAQYHINNLVRDYLFVSDFDDQTVWLEEVITDTGSWTFSGEGIQELAANYFEFSPADGVYDVNLDSRASLEMYAIGITGDVGEVFTLGSGGTIDTSGYDITYIMVFNPDYDDDLNECRYIDYDIDVSVGNGTPLTPITTVDASNFTPLD